MTVPEEYNKPESLRTLATYLRSQNGVKNRSGVLYEKRVDYFKGKRFVECVLEAKKWPKSLPKITDQGIARMVGELMLQNGFFHRSEKITDKKGHLAMSKRQVFEENGYYTWLFQGNMMWSNVLTGIVIVLVIGFTLLPIWPDVAKKVLWYLSVTFLLFTVSFCLIRFLAFLILWLFGYEFWIFPRLFDESLSVQDSFKPVYTFERGTPGQGYYRLAMLLALGAFGYWASTQPTEFDGFIKAQKEFIDDLYSGNLLADVPHNSPQEHMERMKRNRVPNLDDLLREMEAEAIAEKTNEEMEVAKKAKAQREADLDAIVDEDGEGGDDGQGDKQQQQEGEEQEEDDSELKYQFAEEVFENADQVALDDNEEQQEQAEKADSAAEGEL